MPRTGTTLCHSKIGYVNVMLLFRSRHTSYQFTSGPLQWRQRKLSTRRTKFTVTLKFNSSNCNMAFVKLQRTQSLARPTTHAAILTFSTSHKSISSQKHNLSTSLAAPKANPIFHAAK